jgi:protein-L-isoaspartate(D-aspartate) O-methyltransferase
MRPVALALLLLGCARRTEPAPSPSSAVAAPEADAATRARRRMVDEQLVRRGIVDPSVLAAMARVPRHEFVPPHLRDRAYEDHPLPIGDEQTISQPYIVALMTELLHVGRKSRVLEVGTGSGYQAAILGELAETVYTVEILDGLARSAAERLKRLGYVHVEVRAGDGWLGWPEHAPFDAIVVTAAPEQVPPALLEQLAPGGRLVIPVGVGENQDLLVFERTPAGVERHEITPVRFVPMTGGHPPRH